MVSRAALSDAEEKVEAETTALQFHQDSIMLTRTRTISRFAALVKFEQVQD